ncbi:MAG TPA: hypothetical protein VH540_14715 [Ktedonobacterales bacterium]
MQRWEYAIYDITVTQGMLGGTSAKVVFLKHPRREVLEIKPDKSQGDRNIHDAWMRVLAQMGIEGWELAATQGEHIWVFKRPIP